MNHSSPDHEPDISAPRPITVRAVPIELCRFIKFAGLTESGGEANYLIAEGEVTLNGAVETQKRKKLLAGDRVQALGHTLIVQLG